MLATIFYKIYQFERAITQKELQFGEIAILIVHTFIVWELTLVRRTEFHDIHGALSAFTEAIKRIAFEWRRIFQFQARCRLTQR